LLRKNGLLHFTFFDVEHCISRFALFIDYFIIPIIRKNSVATNGDEKYFRIK
jgi:hypothetical protein